MHDRRGDRRLSGSALWGGSGHSRPSGLAVERRERTPELQNELHDAARRYLPRTVPLRPGSKKPVLADWPRRPLRTVAEVDAHWRAEPTANVGILCGNGLVVLDVDPRHGSDATLAALPALPETREAITGRNGRHLHFAGPPDLPSFELGAGVEVKAAGRQVVAPPSVHPETGRLYVWHPARHPDVMPAAPLPDWVVEAASGVAERPSLTLAQRESQDPLLAIPAAVYIPALAGRPVNRQGYAQCPFHAGGRERTPSLHVHGPLWCCHSDRCQPLPGKRRLGGGIYLFAAKLCGYHPLPPRAAHFREVREGLWEHLHPQAVAA